MVGTVAVKYISNKWRTTTILFFFASLVAVAEFMLFFAESIVITLSAFAVLGFASRLFFPNSNGYFSKTNAKRVPWSIFLIPEYVGTGYVPGCFTDSGRISDIIGLQSMVIVFGVISLSLTAIFFIQMKKRNIILEQPQKTAESM